MYYFSTYIILADEYLHFLKSSYPDHKTKLVSVPKSFQYSNVKTHGIHSEGRRRLENYEEEDRKQLHTWVTATAGGHAEEKIFNMMTRKFSDKPCLLVNGFTENDLLKVVRENLKKEGKGTEMSQQVIHSNQNFIYLFISFRKENSTK